ncbi:hypothetical protein TRVA0_018S01530 [Trichomonascus vanleenenianus]|uniref:flavin-containing monooxygenase n=1 Tax=Trichomonascus vanleenenianus TaxID=2268995 RepID=UPI003ECB2968
MTIEKSKYVRPELAYEPATEETFYRKELFGETYPIPGDGVKQAEQWVERFSAAVQSRDPAAAVSGLIAKHSIWRDLLALQWDFRAPEGIDAIKAFLDEHLAEAELTKVRIDPTKSAPTKVSPFKGLEWVQVFFEYKTKNGHGRGVAKLVNTSKEGVDLKALVVFTVLEGLNGFEEVLGDRRPVGVTHGQHTNRESFLERREREGNYGGANQPAVVIVGGGQAGLTIAARLRVMGIDALIIERNPRVGDNWRNRYKFLVLHDPVWYDHLPYIKFPDTWPIYTPKDKLGDFFEFYSKALELNVWTSSSVDGGKYNEATKTWSVDVKRPDGSRIELTPRHVVLATGHSGEPNIPKFPGVEKFKGKIVHSSQHGSGADWKGKKAVVVGCCNSGLDITHDFYEQGADVTVYQRSSTYVVSIPRNEETLQPLYQEHGPPVEEADLTFHSSPSKINFAILRAVAAGSYKRDKALIDSLTAKGFKVDFGYDGTGLWAKYFIRGGGYYIDVGAVGLIADDKVKVKQGGEIVDFTEDSIVFSDGTSLKADIVVLATGYQNMRSTAAKIFGDALGDKLNDVWGLDGEYELNTVWRASGHPRFWFMGGNLALCRFYSKRLALQIAAEEANLK